MLYFIYEPEIKERERMKTRNAFLAIAAVSAVCLAFYGCDGDGGGVAGAESGTNPGYSSNSGSGFTPGKNNGSSNSVQSGQGSGSGSVVSCYVELPGGDGSASCSEVPTSYKTTDKFKETCEAQNVTGYSKATFGSGCPAGGKKCDQGGGIVAFYYGAAAEVNSCLDEYTDDDYGSSSDYGSGSDYGYSGDGGSSSYDDGGSSSYDSGTYYDGDYVLPDDYYGGLDIQSGSNATISGNVYSCKAVSSGHSYCGEISQSSSEVNDFRAGCNEERGTLGTGCPASSKKCQFDELLIYFYDSGDITKSCEELYEVDW